MTDPSPRLAARTALTRIGTSLLSLISVSAWCQEQPTKPLMSVEEAIQGLNSPSAEVQYEAAFALSKSGAKAKPAVPAIVEILNRGGRECPSGTAVGVGRTWPGRSRGSSYVDQDRRESELSRSVHHGTCIGQYRARSSTRSPGVAENAA